MRAWLILLLMRVFSWLPLSASQRVGVVLGRVTASLPGRFRKAARINIQRCLPELGAEQHRQLLHDSLLETGKAALEISAIWFWPAARVLPLVREVHGGELVEQARTAGKGVILALPHLGCWEILALYSSAQWPTTSLYRPPYLGGLDRTVRMARQRLGATLVPTDTSGVRSLYKALGRDEVVCILPDQEPDSEGGVFAPFFGIPAYTMTLLSRLAHKTGATVIFGYAERLPRGAGYRAHFLAAPPGVGGEDPLAAATQLNQGIERCVRNLPNQYQWAYARFKTRPPGEPRFYRRPRSQP